MPLELKILNPEPLYRCRWPEIHRKALHPKPQSLNRYRLSEIYRRALHPKPQSLNRYTAIGVFRKLGVPPYNRILLFKVLYQGPLFSETPIGGQRLQPSEALRPAGGGQALHSTASSDPGLAGDVGFAGLKGLRGLR